MTDFPDYYALLGIEQTASPSAIKSAYKAALLKHHPDRNGARVDADEVTRQLIEARDTLLDPARRVTYDRLLSHWAEARRWSCASSTHGSAGQEEAEPPRDHRWSASQPSGDTNHSDGSRGERGHARGPGWPGWVVAGLGLLGLGTIVVLAANRNEYDPATGRYRDRHGKFRGGPFF